jgi:Glycosyl hydrolase family 26
MELHRRVFGALSPFLLAGVFVVGFVVSTDVSRGADGSDADVQVIYVSGLSNLRGWEADHARARVVRRGDDAALVRATRRHGVFALGLRPGPRAKTVALDEYAASAKVKARRGKRIICLYLRERHDGQTVGRIAECLVVGRGWTTLTTSSYPALGDGNRFVLDIFSVARGGTTARRSFLLSSAKITRQCKSIKAAAACGTSSGGATTGTSTGGAGTTTDSGTTSGTTSVATTTTTPTTTEPSPPVPPPTTNPIPAPNSGVLLGAKPGYYQADVSALESLIGRNVAIRQTFVDWTKTWPDSRTVDDHAKGRIPLISWKGTHLADVTSGSFDSMIRQRAQAAKALGFPIFVRWAHEMNADWYPWGKQPDLYVAAWKRIHTIFEQEGATNVAWVWAPSIPRGNWDAYYPGDAYVDWIGGDNYNWGTCKTPSAGWKVFVDMFKPYHDHFAGKGKPMMIAETGSAEQGGSKKDWLRDAAATIKTLPAYHAWVQSQYTDGDCDWRVDSSADALEAYRALAADPYFNPE